MSEPQRSPRRGVGIKWKIMCGLVSGVMLFGILVVGVVNYQMTRVLWFASAARN